MDHAKIQRAEAVLKYQFEDQHILWEALQVPGSGVLRSGPRLFYNGNLRLAVLGDAVADMVLCQVWYERGESKDAWNRTRGAVLGNINLAAVARQHSLGECLNMNPSNPLPPPLGQKVMAALVEALIGAVFEDGGLAAASQVMQTLGLQYV